jgi:hypothetical protein
MAADDALADAKALYEAALSEEEQEQLELLEPLTAEETAAAQEELGPLAGPLSVMRHARAKRKAGRPKGARNKRTHDFERMLAAHGPDPAVVLAKILADSEEAMVERSRAMDPEKRRLSYADARAMRIRCAEALLPYRHGKKPVQVDATIRGVMVVEEISGGVRPTIIDGDAEPIGVLPIGQEGEE